MSHLYYFFLFWRDQTCFAALATSMYMLSTYHSLPLYLHPSIKYAHPKLAHFQEQQPAYTCLHAYLHLSTCLSTPALHASSSTLPALNLSSDKVTTCLHAYLPTPTYTYPTSIYLHLSTPIYTYLHLSTPIYTYLHLSTPIYTYLHLPTPPYTYLHPCLCATTV